MVRQAGVMLLLAINHMLPHEAERETEEGYISWY